MLSRFVGRFVSLSLALVLAGCASAGSTANGGSSRDVLSEPQLAQVEHLNAFEAVRRLRPMWLRVRGRDSIEQTELEGIRVYLDGVLQGGVGALRGMPVRTISEIRFLDSREATLRFGTDHGDGAIMVATR